MNQRNPMIFTTTAIRESGGGVSVKRFELLFGTGWKGKRVLGCFFRAGKIQERF
jgi:hypothetical protein